MINYYKLLKNQLGGDCNPLPDLDDDDVISGENLLDLYPAERITIQNKCYAVKSLYEWIITRQQNLLPLTQTIITPIEKHTLKKAYQAINNCNPLPDDEDIITTENLFNLDPIERIFIKNKCYALKSLYKWIIEYNNNVLPGIQKVISPEERERLIHEYQVLLKMLTRDKLIHLCPNFRRESYFNLSNKGFTSIARGIFDNLLNLNILNLSNNQIQVLHPNTFNNLPNLHTLNLNKNQISELPSTIFNNLLNLENLDLSNNSLLELDKNIFNNLSNLENLDLNNNYLQELDQDIFNNLLELQILNLSYNYLQRLHQNIFNNLSRLFRLFLNNNQISILQPGTFDNLSELVSLYLNINLIQELQPGIFNLPRLQNLYLDNNQIREIQPLYFNNLPRLKNLYLNHNQINTIGINSIIQYNLPRLQSLQLNNNEISEIKQNIFNLPRLKQLHLLDNLIYYELQQNQFYGLSDNVFIDYGTNV